MSRLVLAVAFLAAAFLAGVVMRDQGCPEPKDEPKPHERDHV